MVLAETFRGIVVWPDRAQQVPLALISATILCGGSNVRPALQGSCRPAGAFFHLKTDTVRRSGANEAVKQAAVVTEP